MRKALLAIRASFFVGLARGFELLEILGGFFLEILLAGFAAEFDFLTFVREHKGLHVGIRAEFFVRDDARVEGIGFDGGLLVFGKRRGDQSSQGHQQTDAKHRCFDCVQEFHGSIVVQ
jgi:hypothetical protein